jgi:hypothetical protein
MFLKAIEKKQKNTNRKITAYTFGGIDKAVLRVNWVVN